ncbi:MAG TPA: DnaA/Hda family protein [Rhizomicrobium sp.]|jgi:chromosomal replication initiator protein|nr:DnaA/Hda family protein [Rhizomicrobium sp.]
MTQPQTKTPDWLGIWNTARDRLRRQLGGATFDAWIGKLVLLEFSKDDLKFGAPKPFVRNWVTNNFTGRIEKALRAAGGVPASITIVLQETEAPRVGGGLPTQEKPPASAPVSEAAGAAQPSQPVAERLLFARLPKPALSFAAFVEGPANALALRAARTFAEDDTDDISLLFIHGGFGFGKTHLLNATALEARRRGKRALLLGSEDMMRQFLGALGRRDTLSFKEELRAADMLLIDDLQHLCRSSSTMSELLHTLNAYSDLRRKVVIAGDKPPGAMENLGPDVRSRLCGGLAIGLEKPDRATRLAILKARAEEFFRLRPQEAIPEETLARLADVDDTTPRDLVGFFHNLTVHLGVTKNPQALNVAVDAMVSRGPLPPKTSIDDIQRKTAEYYKLDPRDFLSAQRSRRVARPRQVAMFLARTITERSLPDIGRRFGGRDHTTVLHACRRIAALCAEDPTFKQEIEYLRTALLKR